MKKHFRKLTEFTMFDCFYLVMMAAIGLGLTSLPFWYQPTIVSAGPVRWMLVPIGVALFLASLVDTVRRY